LTFQSGKTRDIDYAGVPRIAAVEVEQLRRLCCENIAWVVSQHVSRKSNRHHATPRQRSDIDGGEQPLLTIVGCVAARRRREGLFACGTIRRSPAVISAAPERCGRERSGRSARTPSMIAIGSPISLEGFEAVS
jgi:hypothetical protein